MINNRTTHISIVLLILFLGFNSNAQNRFQKTFGGAVLDWSNSVIQTNDSNYVLLGSTKNFGAGMQDILLIKTNTSGDTLWSSALGLPPGDEEGATVQQTSDGGFIITGTTWSTGAGGDDFILIKTNASGVVDWSRTYGGANVDFCTGGQPCFDGGYVLSGYTTSYGAGGADMYVIRTNAAGDTLWTRTIGNNGPDYAYSIAQTSDSGFVLTGSFTVSGNDDMALVKLDASGSLMWAKVIGDSADEVGYSVIQSADGGYCIAGSTLSFGNGNMDGFMAKTDDTGTLLWTQAFGTSDSDLFYCVKPLNDGTGYVATGYANRQGSAHDDLILLKTDLNGAIVWSSVMGGTTAGRDVGRYVFETWDGSFLVSGFTQSFGGGTEAYFIKTDSQGSAGCNIINVVVSAVAVPAGVTTIFPVVKAGTTITIPIVSTGSAPVNNNTLCVSTNIFSSPVLLSGMLIEPNPMTSQTQVILSGIKNINLQLNLVDITGKEVVTLQSADAIIADETIRFSINRENLIAGIYFIRITDSKTNLVATGKLVIQQ
ncbi:MAG: T9SS type A sorting domain-containing protein [Bacteroidota bacterium]